jgi:hypothetical protein
MQRTTRWIAALPLSNGSDFTLRAGSAAFIPEFAGDRSQTVLRDISEGTPGNSTLTIPGLTFSLVLLH